MTCSTIKTKINPFLQLKPAKIKILSVQVPLAYQEVTLLQNQNKIPQLIIKHKMLVKSKKLWFQTPKTMTQQHKIYSNNLMLWITLPISSLKLNWKLMSFIFHRSILGNKSKIHIRNNLLLITAMLITVMLVLLVFWVEIIMSIIIQRRGKGVLGSQIIRMLLIRSRMLVILFPCWEASRSKALLHRWW